MDYENPAYQSVVAAWAKQHENAQLHNLADNCHRDEIARQEFSQTELDDMCCPLGFGAGNDYA